MTKRQALVGYVACAVAAAGLTALIDLALIALGAGWLAWALNIAFLTGLVVVTWGCFMPNAGVFGRVIDGVGVTERVVALTFDDGPSPDVTPRILDVLRREHVRATFFVLGRHAERHPELVERMVREGHEVASHGWSHGVLTFAGPRRIVWELVRTQRLLERLGVRRVRLFRAPHGFRNPFVVRTAQRLGYRVVGWSAGVFDTARPGADVIVARTKRALEPGAIVLLHDADGNGTDDRTQTAEALPAIVDAVRHASLRPVTVSELHRYAPVRAVSWRRLALVATGAAVLVTFGYERLDRDEVLDSLATFRGLSLPLVVAALLANLVSVFFKASVWKAALDTIPGGRRFRYGEVMPALFIGFLLNSVLIARIGEVGRIYVLRRRLAKEGTQVSTPTIAGTVVMEQLFLGLSLLLVLLVGAVTIDNGVPEWVGRSTLVFAAVLLALLVGVVALDVFSRVRRRRRARAEDGASLAEGWWRSLLRNAEGIVHAVSRGQRILRDPGRAAWSIVAGLLSWVAQIVGILWTLEAFGIRNGLGAAGVVFLVSTLIGLFPVVPGNIGVFQIAVALSLSQAFDVSTARGTAFAIGLQFIEVALGVGLGLLFLSLEGLSFGEVRRGIHAADVEAARTTAVPVVPALADEPDQVRQALGAGSVST